MRSAVAPLDLMRPGSLDEALRMLRDEGPLKPIAGCTDVYVMMQFGQLHAARYLDLWRLDELRGIHRSGSHLRIGALTTFTDLIRSADVHETIPILAQAAREIGGMQIQNRGTLGGNIANGSPAGDTLPVLAVAEATLVLQRAGGERRVPFHEFYTGYRSSVLQPDELITSIEIPAIDGSQYFRKVGTRASQAISKLVIAAVRGDYPRIALGSVAPTVVRLPRTEASLANRAPIDVALGVLFGEIAPIDDLRSTAHYRKQVAANLLARWWSESH